MGKMNKKRRLLKRKEAVFEHITKEYVVEFPWGDIKVLEEATGPSFSKSILKAHNVETEHSKNKQCFKNGMMLKMRRNIS